MTALLLALLLAADGECPHGWTVETEGHRACLWPDGIPSPGAPTPCPPDAIDCGTSEFKGVVFGPPFCKEVCRKSTYQLECVHADGSVDWTPGRGDLLCIDIGAITTGVLGSPEPAPEERFPHTTPANVCPVCKREGRKSTVRYASEGMVYSCCAIYAPGDSFFDEDGKHHSHMPYPCCGDGSTFYTCSNGHSYKIMPAAERCWCGWPVRGPYGEKKIDHKAPGPLPRKK